MSAGNLGYLFLTSYGRRSTGCRFRTTCHPPRDSVVSIVFGSAMRLRLPSRRTTGFSGRARLSNHCENALSPAPSANLCSSHFIVERLLPPESPPVFFQPLDESSTEKEPQDPAGNRPNQNCIASKEWRIIEKEHTSTKSKASTGKSSKERAADYIS